jgi:GntR family transcriptional regulator of vanillate catabolism
MLLRALDAVCSLPFAEPGALVFTTADPGPEDFRSNVVAIEHHRAILDAIERREGTRAECLAREHSRMARTHLDRATHNRDLLRHVPGASLIAQPDGP